MAQLQFCAPVLDEDTVDDANDMYEEIVMPDQLVDDEIGIPSEDIREEEYGGWCARNASLNHDYLPTGVGSVPPRSEFCTSQSVSEQLDADAKLSAVIESVASTASFDSYVIDEENSDLLPCGAYEVDSGEAQPSRRKKATIVQCEYCGVVIKHPSKIQAHMRTHTGEKPFECGICGMRFTQRTPMRMHVRRHIGDTPFTCSWGCGKSFASNALKNAHELRIHLGEKRQGPPRPHLKPPRRSVPMRVVLPLSEEERSAILDWQPPIGDIKQPISAAANRKLDEVIDAVAAGVPLPPPRQTRRRAAIVAQCQQCGLLLKHPSKIQAHMRTHTGERPFECGECGMRFATANPLRVHLRRAHTGEKPYECTWECGRRFVSISARNEHERIVHAGIKRYQCTVGSCRRLFTRRRYLLLHQHKEHEETARRADDAIQCVLNMVEEKVRCEEKSAEEEDSMAPRWLPTRRIPSKKFELDEDEEDDVETVHMQLDDDDEDEVIDESEIGHEVVLYEDDTSDSVENIIIEGLHNDAEDVLRPTSHSVLLQRLESERVELDSEPFDATMPGNILDVEESAEAYFLDEELDFQDASAEDDVLQGRSPLDRPPTLVPSKTVLGDDGSVVETRHFWFPVDSEGGSSSMVHRVGRVRIVKPSLNATLGTHP